MRKVVPSLIIAGLLVSGGVASCAAPESAPETTATASAAPSFSAEQLDLVAPADARAITNPADPQATLVLFTDYECPYCAKVDPMIQQAKEDYGDEVRILVRNYPLSKHLNAEPAARAVEAAAEQGKLEDMSALLFEHQQDWAAETEVDDAFAGYAEELDLDMDKFRADYGSEAIKARVAKDLEDARTLQIKGTPTVILDGQVLQLNSTNFSELQEPLDNALGN